jgi:hypothetical protein
MTGPTKDAFFTIKPLLLAAVVSSSLALFSADVEGPGSAIGLLDPSEVAAPRPYEMVWANRVEPAPPTLRFDRLDGWTVQCENGAQARLQVTRTQNVWDRTVARLQYRGAGKPDEKPSVVLRPPQPIELPVDADSVEMWVNGNRWDWENPPGTPPVRLVLHLRDGQNKARTFEVDRVRWQEWWLVHKRLPEDLNGPSRLEAIEIAGGWQPDWRELFFDSLRVYREELPPLHFEPRAQRNISLFEGQSRGVNAGAGKLPFPVREETILPVQLEPAFQTQIEGTTNLFTLLYRGSDCVLAYRFDATKGLSGITVEVDPGSNRTLSFKATLLDGAKVRLDTPGDETQLTSVVLDQGVINAAYSDGTVVRLRLWQKSLVLDVINRSGRATELDFGHITGVVEPRTIWIPYLTYGGGAHPSVLLSRAGAGSVFASIWLDWYRSNGSEPYAAEAAGTNAARINGGVRYHSRTDGQRNPLFERIFLTVSPAFEEVLPTVPNPVSLHGPEAMDRLWQESWGPDDYEKQMKRSRVLRAYGIDKLIQCNHEIAWRDAGESFTLRLRAAPKKGGDTALQRYVAHQRSLGWLEGLYSNYTDYAPVNEFWSPDGVQRLSDGDWRTAWPRCYAEKPLKAVEFDALLAPQIKAKYNPNSAYTDVHTAVSPWGYNDYDARVPGAGTFAQTFYAYGELLRNDSRVYGGPIFSEGTYHWLYAGLADGNYALAYDGRPLATAPLLPVFDLYQIHTKECDIGMGWTAHFCDAIADWHKPENLDRAIDRFLLHTLAYGHIGWLVEEEHGIARTCRSYYMLQQVQSGYGLKAPARIAYWDGNKLVSLSEALVNDLPRTRRQLYVEYPGGLQLWLNDHPSENWTVRTSQGVRFRRRPNPADPPNELVLPPAGWAAVTHNGELFSYSALQGTNRVDYLRSPAYTYLDGRGNVFATPEAQSDGALAIRPLANAQLEVIRISGKEPFVVRRPYSTSGRLSGCDAYDLERHALAAPVWQDADNDTRIEPVQNAIRYVLHFSR